MKRRDFNTSLAAGGLGITLARWRERRGAPAEGKDYVRLSTPAPVVTPASDKKIEVVEFFWYGCPACNAFEPQLENWVRRLPADVAFRRVHVGFGPVHQFHQKLFYAIEDSGQFAALHRKVFAAIHQQGKRLLKEDEVGAFVKEAGGDAAKVLDAMKSFSVNTAATRAKQLTDAYKIDGVPALGVHGRFYTSGSLAGPADRVLQVTDFLIDRVRKGA